MRAILLLSMVAVCWLKADSQTLFPEKCLGTWRGMMHIFHYGQQRDSVPVVLTVKAIGPDSWSWKTEYRSAKMPMTKDYSIRVKDREKRVFITDEGDGIELTDYQTGDKLYSVFETSGILLTSSYELRGESLIFEVTPIGYL